mmetsp:Transcript_9330/g.21310  ORF Transcript_9330/g.21310 Transcript_9330/m.21310 type:complete len:214 (+) Transcript_9330:90-731(+)|eukprot:CAMPEP_0114548954 /NCGR_PEP_ID=MMETSP0114-20121206/5263_1 /TAXON_ID=31324 /ORGANISM="Goniomonas sp, Strain m" /LENGTH=213 /DNA_ID=CAMNT_0001733591 /DNA_START=84 /DNA_END=725 /DNA_ORIENTATION=-
MGSKGSKGQVPAPQAQDQPVATKAQSPLPVKAAPTPSPDKQAPPPATKSPPPLASSPAGESSSALDSPALSHVDELTSSLYPSSPTRGVGRSPSPTKLPHNGSSGELHAANGRNSPVTQPGPAIVPSKEFGNTGYTSDTNRSQLNKVSSAKGFDVEKFRRANAKPNPAQAGSTDPVRPPHVYSDVPLRKSLDNLDSLLDNQDEDLMAEILGES